MHFLSTFRVRFVGAMFVSSGLALLSGGCPASSGDPTPSAGQVHEISIKDFAFSNLDLTIAKGDTVRWTNQDPDLHTVTSGDPDVDSPAPGELFDSGLLLPGATFQKTFDNAGSFEYFCLRHYMTDPNTMRHAKITVTP